MDPHFVDLNSAYDFEKIKKRLAKKLDAHRYEHSIGVAYTAAALAMAHDEDMIKAYTAGLLHDCAKCLDEEERERACRKYKVELTEMEKEFPFLIHSKLGAVLAKEKYGIEDPEILSSIRYHTTGKPEIKPVIPKPEHNPVSAARPPEKTEKSPKNAKGGSSREASSPFWDQGLIISR